MPFTPHDVTAAGLRLSVQRGGRGAPLLYLHDAGADTAKAPVLSELAGEFDVAVPDLPGYGTSSPPHGLASAREMSEVLVALIRAIGWTRATVAGTSLGAWFAVELALAHPDVVHGLVLCGAAGLHVPEDYLFALFAGGNAAASTQRLLEGALVSRLPVAERSITDLPPAVAAAVMGPHVQGLAAAAACSWNPWTANPRLLGRLHQVRCPTVLLWGDRDALIPVQHGRHFVQAIPGARLEILPGAGHLVPLERPEAFAAAVRAVTRPAESARRATMLDAHAAAAGDARRHPRVPRGGDRCDR